MKSVGSGGGESWRRVVGAIAAVLVLIGLAPAAAEAQSASIVACGRVEVRQIVAGSQLVYSQCGDRFTMAQPYIALIIELTRVRGRTLVSTELLDPEQNSVWSFSLPVAPPEGQDVIYAKLWFWAVLPVAAEPGVLIAADRTFLFHMLALRGKPARERPGEWTLKVSINNGPPLVRKFALQAAPDTATPTPAPTPAPSPTPEATPSP